MRLAAAHGRLRQDMTMKAGPDSEQAVTEIIDRITKRSDVEVNALAINVAVPESLRWTDVRHSQTFDCVSCGCCCLAKSWMTCGSGFTRTSWDCCIGSGPRSMF
jgi:hypothetical protein